MAIITISRGSYSKGKEVAEGVAEKLGYECLSRDVILEASDRFNVPVVLLRQAIEEPPSIIQWFTHSTPGYITYIKSAITQRLRKDNVVYHGLAGHLLLHGIPHVLKVRILAEMSTRAAAVMKTGVADEAEARRRIARIDEQRRKWTWRLYGVDNSDPALYDLVIHIDKIDVSTAIDVICQAASHQVFVTTEEGQAKMDDLALACAVKATLLELSSDVCVTSEFGNVLVYTRTESPRLDERVATLSGDLEGIHHIEVRVGMPIPPNAV